MNTIIVGIGEALWDMLPQGKQIGGAPANFAYHLSQLGFESYVVSAIGVDTAGDELEALLIEKGLKYQLSRVPYPTGTVQVMLDSKGIPEYEITPGVAWDHIPFTPELADLAGRADAVCFGSLAQREPESRHTILQFLDAMTKENAMKIFDINLRQHHYSKEIITASLEACTILKINDEELEMLGKMFGYAEKDFQRICIRLMDDYNLKMLILTCGIRGNYVFTPDSFSFLDTPKVEIADTVGAGDSFTASFCAALLKGHSIEEAQHFATDVAAYICTHHGAMPVLPDQLKARI